MCENMIRKGRCGCCVIKKRCVCWEEPVRVRSPRPRCGYIPHIEGLSLEYGDCDNLAIAASDPILFDELLTDDSWCTTYHEDCGCVKICRRGVYMIDWNVTVENPNNECLCFGIEVNDEVKDCSAINTAGQIHGHALVRVTEVPTRIKLVNASCKTVTLAPVKPAANFRIVSVD